MAGAALMLAGCGFADVRSPVPEFMRAKAPEPPALEPAPDIKRMLKEKLDAVFTAASQPTQVRVSEPRPNLRGPGWTACVKAEVISVTGKPLGTQTYRVEISGGVIADRQKVEAGGHLQCRELRAGLAATGSGSSPAPDKASARSKARTAPARRGWDCRAHDR